MKIVQTIGVSVAQTNNEEFSKFVTECLDRFLEGDWGDVCKQVWKANDKDLAESMGRILASYLFPQELKVGNEKKLWIVRDFVRVDEQTIAPVEENDIVTVLFPSEY